MYEDFHATDRWSGQELHCQWKSTATAIATRHADAIDVCFLVNGRSLVIALPAQAWVEQKSRTGHVITDALAAQIAGSFLHRLIEEGFESTRQFYSMSVAEVLEALNRILSEAKSQGSLPAPPVIA